MGCGASAKQCEKEDGAAPAPTPAADVKPAEQAKSANEVKPANEAKPAAEAKKNAEEEPPAKPADAPLVAEAKKPAEEEPPAKPAAEAPTKEAEATKDEAPAGRSVKIQESAEDEEDEDDENEAPMDEEEFERQVALRVQREQGNQRKTRAAVSAETTERDKSWKAPEYDKTEEQEVRLTEALNRSFMFSCLSSEDFATVLKAFKEVVVPAGEVVIEQGGKVEAGDNGLFVLEVGKLRVHRDGSEAPVHTYDTPGSSFGELALLYNAPRAATVIADEDCVLWSIDRDTFNFLVKDASRIAVERRMAFLSEVPLLNAINKEEKAKLCDVMQVRIIPKDGTVMVQGEAGKEFCILESGRCEAIKDGVSVFEYKPKDFFGELALTKEAPRAATVVATEMSKVLCISSDVFNRMIGSLEDKIRERAAEYEKVASAPEVVEAPAEAPADETPAPVAPAPEAPAEG